MINWQTEREEQEKCWIEHGLPLVDDPLVKAISANRRISFSETSAQDIERCIAAASDAMPGDNIAEERLRERIRDKVNMSSEHFSLAVVNVGDVSRTMKAGGRSIPLSHHPGQPTVLERFVLNGYPHVTCIIEAKSFRTNRISQFARRFYRVIGVCEDAPGRAIMVQGHEDNVEILVLCHYNCPKGHISWVIWRVRFGPLVLSEQAKRERDATSQEYKGKGTPKNKRWKVKDDRCTRCQ